MPPRFINVLPGKKSKIPYLDTEVPFEKSFSEIQGMLIKYGCEDILARTTQSFVPKTKQPCTLYTIAFINKGAKFFIEFPVVLVHGGRDGKEIKIAMNVSGRIILNKIKATLVDVEIEYLTFHQAMMPYQLIVTPEGNTRTMSDFVDENRDRLQAGSPNVFCLEDKR